MDNRQVYGRYTAATAGHRQFSSKAIDMSLETDDTIQLLPVRKCWLVEMRKQSCTEMPLCTSMISKFAEYTKQKTSA